MGSRLIQIATEGKDTSRVIQKRARIWMVIGPAGQLVCITLYKRGAEEVVRRLAT